MRQKQACIPQTNKELCIEIFTRSEQQELLVQLLREAAEAPLNQQYSVRQDVLAQSKRFRQRNGAHQSRIMKETASVRKLG